MMQWDETYFEIAQKWRDDRADRRNQVDTVRARELFLRYFSGRYGGSWVITLKQGDCLELMQDIPDWSIDMILADLH
jgi:hypothetical protein